MWSNTFIIYLSSIIQQYWNVEKKPYIVFYAS
jgi:hypothetical protein